MRTKSLGVSALFLGLTLSGGCLSTNHRAYHESMHCTDLNPFPMPVRSQVYLFLMNGSDALELAGMLTLRDEVGKAGYAKVYYTQSQDRDYYYREMQRLHRDEPQARMLLLGYGTAATNVLELAAVACRTGLPLDAVIFLDPAGVSGNLADTLPVPTVALRSHNWSGGKELVTTDTLQLDGVGHLSVPTNPTTVNAVVQLMTASAAKVPVEDIRLTLPFLPLRNKPERTPRGIDPATLSEPTGAWEGFPAMPAPLIVPKVVTPPAPAVPVPAPTAGTLPPPRPVPGFESPKK